jgi:hypothetical protein
MQFEYSLKALTLQSQAVTICTTSLNILRFRILPTECNGVFSTVVTVNSNYFPKQHSQIYICSGDVMCFPRGTN